MRAAYALNEVSVWAMRRGLVSWLLGFREDFPVGRYSQALARAEGLMKPFMQAVMGLHDAAASAAWRDEDGAALRETLEELEWLLGSPWARGLSGEQHLEELTLALTGVRDRILAKHGAFAIPQDADTDVYAYHRDKLHPWAPLQRLVAGLWHPDAPDTASTGTAPSALGTFLDARRDSGFEAAVATVRDRRALGEPVGGAVSDAIVLLAARLTGTDATQWPQRLRPEISIGERQDLRIPQAAGLNVASHQTRKELFETANWQVHLPAPLLDTHNLEDRMAGLAERLACDVMAFMIHGQDPARLQQVLHVGGGAHPSMLEPIAKEAIALRPTSDAAIERDPRCAAAIVRRGVASTTTKREDRAWHEGWRPSTKAAAAGDPRALELVIAKSLARWQFPAVALRRAVVGATPEAVKDAVDRLPPGLRAIVRVAAITQDRFTPELVRATGGDIPPEAQALLEGLGLFADGRIASPAIAEVVMQRVPQGLRDRVVALCAA